MPFLGELGAAQQVSVANGLKSSKKRGLDRYLDGIATKQFNKMKRIWASELPTLEHLMNKMMKVYDKEIAVKQSMRLMWRETK